MSSIPADLSPRARIRLAALHVFAEQGLAKATVRQVAARAEVSPGLVMHHFGSRAGLREACDEFVVQQLQEEHVLMALSNPPRVGEYLDRHPELAPLMDYLAAGLREGGEVADRIFDAIMGVTRQMMDVAERNGIAHLPADREAALALLVTTSLGVVLLQKQFSRALGGTDLTDPAVIDRYGRTSAEVYAHGVFTPDYYTALAAANGWNEGPHHD